MLYDANWEPTRGICPMLVAGPGGPDEAGLFPPSSATAPLLSAIGILRPAGVTERRKAIRADPQPPRGRAYARPQVSVNGHDVPGAGIEIDYRSAAGASSARARPRRGHTRYS